MRVRAGRSTKKALCTLAHIQETSSCLKFEIFEQIGGGEAGSCITPV